MDKQKFITFTATIEGGDSTERTLLLRLAPLISSRKGILMILDHDPGGYVVGGKVKVQLWPNGKYILSDNGNGMHPLPTGKWGSTTIESGVDPQKTLTKPPPPKDNKGLEKIAKKPRSIPELTPDQLREAYQKSQGDFFSDLMRTMGFEQMFNGSKSDPALNSMASGRNYRPVSGSPQ